jgi:predicted nucleic acid-binding protein
MDEDIDQQFLVVDASVILAAILPQEAHAKIALTFIKRSTNERKKLIAPSILLYEVFNAVRSAILSKRISEDEARVILAAYTTIEPIYIDFSLLSQNALKVALESDCSVYDAAYAALAHERECSMCTLDKKLIQKLKVFPVNVIYLGERL